MTIPDLNSDDYLKRNIFNKRKKKNPFLTWARRIITFFAVVFGSGLLVLYTFQGNSETMREGLESSMSSLIGMDVRIGTLKRFSIFPNTEINAEDIVIHAVRYSPSLDREFETAPSLQSETPEITVKKLHLVMSFWDLFIQKPVLAHFNITDFYLSPEFTGNKPITFDTITIADENADTDENSDKPKLTFSGQVNEKSFSGDLEVDRKYGLINERPLYTVSFNAPRSLSFAITDILLNTNISPDVENRKTDLLDLTLSKAGIPLLTGDINIEYNQPRILVNGQLAQDEMLLNLNYDSGGNAMKGSTTVPVLYLEDFGDETGNIMKTKETVQELTAFIMDIIPGRNESDETTEAVADFTAENLIDIQSIYFRGKNFGNLKIPVFYANNVIEAKDVTGVINDGEVKANAAYNLDDEQAGFVLKVKEWDYGPLQKALNDYERVQGRMNIKLDLNARGNNVQEFLGTLNGTAKFIAGEGQFESAALNFWGGGLVNAILPKLNPDAETNLNCAILDLEIENGLADIKSMFLDTGRVTLVGNGDIDFGKNRINILLDPKAKQTALVDVATSVLVQGPIDKPVIGVDPLALGTKLGKLFAGLINPAFLAASLIDLGLTEQHPCMNVIDNYKDNKNAFPPQPSPVTTEENRQDIKEF